MQQEQLAWPQSWQASSPELLSAFARRQPHRRLETVITQLRGGADRCQARPNASLARVQSELLIAQARLSNPAVSAGAEPFRRWIPARIEALTEVALACRRGVSRGSMDEPALSVLPAFENPCLLSWCIIEHLPDGAGMSASIPARQLGTLCPSGAKSP